MKTGLNPAFVIDANTRKKLIEEDPKSAGVIKPLVRGRDVDRWTIEESGLWLIFTRRGIDIEAYPAIKAHLLPFRSNLEPKPKGWKDTKWEGRKSGTYKWFEIQDPVDYWEEFQKPKIFYQVIQTHPCYAIDWRGGFGNDKTFYLLSDDYFLLGLLNSPLMWWHNFRYLPHMINEALTPQGFKMESLPIAIPTDAVRRETEFVVERLIGLSGDRQVCSRDLLDWLKVQYEITEPNTKLQNPIALSSDQFVAEVTKARGKKSGLSVAGQKKLREEFARSIDPAKAQAAEAAKLELRIHDLVNEAYGLTPDEVRLMWDTAPPRMPIPRPPGI